MDDEIGWLAAEAETGGDQEPSDRLGAGGIERNEMTGRSPASNDESQNPHFWQKRPEMGHPVRFPGSRMAMAQQWSRCFRRGMRRSLTRRSGKGGFIEGGPSRCCGGI